MTLEPHQMTVRLPESVYEKLRREAFERRMPMSEVINEALQEHLITGAPDCECRNASKRKETP